MVVPLIWMLICSVLDLAALLLRVMTSMGLANVLSDSYRMGQ